MNRPSPRAASLRRGFVMVFWPLGLLTLLAVSLPRAATLGGRVYLIVTDAAGIAAGVRFARRAGTSARGRDAESDVIY